MLFRRVLQHVKEQNWTAVALDFVIVVVGVFVGLQVSNWNDAQSDKQLRKELLNGFRQDLQSDAIMLATEIEARRKQLSSAQIVLEFYGGRPLDLDIFFGAYHQALFSRKTKPHRNTMDEVLNTGGLRLIEDRDVRKGLLDLYATYQRIVVYEEHIARDMETYLYDQTFATVPYRFGGAWEDTAVGKLAATDLLNNVATENGFRLIAINLQYEGEEKDLLEELELANAQVQELLEVIGPE